MKYSKEMTPEELDALMSEIRALEEAYAAQQSVEPFNENDLEDWTDKEYRMLRP